MPKQKSRFSTLIVVSLSLLLIFAIGAVAWAVPFVNPPETNAPDWRTGDPYQRNIYLDFSVSPAGGPPGIPGADYGGTLDSALLGTDYGQFNGVFAWFDTTDITTRTGLVGIDNRCGIETVQGVLLLHIDNTPLGDLKHFWAEWEYTKSSEAVGTAGIGLPDGYELTQPLVLSGEEAGDGFYRINLWGEIEPNPSYEWFALGAVSVPAGEYILFDSLHIATECVPEPCTMLLLGSGLAGLLGISRKRLSGKV